MSENLFEKLGIKQVSSPADLAFADYMRMMKDQSESQKLMREQVKARLEQQYPCHEAFQGDKCDDMGDNFIMNSVITNEETLRKIFQQKEESAPCEPPPEGTTPPPLPVPPGNGISLWRWFLTALLAALGMALIALIVIWAANIWLMPDVPATEDPLIWEFIENVETDPAEPSN